MATSASINKTDLISLISSYLMYVFFAIVLLMPFHAFITTWLGSGFSSDFTQDAIKAWKEILIFITAVPVLYVLFKKPKIRQKLLSRKITQLILLYAFVHLLVFAIKQPQGDAAIVSLMINLRFLAFFIIGQMLILLLRSPKKLENRYERILLITSTAVGLFGMAQVLVLPSDWLSHFGYGPDSIPVNIPIDQNPDFLRFSSTLRGANPLGAFMILPIAAATWLWYKTKRGFYLAILVPLVFAEAMSLSRSAWAGTLIALGVLVATAIPKQHLKKAALIGIGLLVTGSLIVYGLRNTDTIQNLVFHEDPESTSQRAESNTEHLDSIEEGIKDIVEEPLGAGPGTAGPASFYNEEQSRISENYFIQVAQEVGVIGLAIFVAICVQVALSMWRQRENSWARILFASFMGLTFVSLLLHGWADESVALTWWGFAGLLYKE